jgi:hypothetical protein
MVLKANETIVAMETPFERVLVSKISAGMIQESGPHVAEKEKLYAQVQMMNPHEAPLLVATPGGNCAISMHAMRKQS